MRQLRSYMTSPKKTPRDEGVWGTHLHKCDVHLSCKIERSLFLFPSGYLVIMPQVVQ